MKNEKALLQRARQLDEQALTEIYDVLSPAIYAYALRLSGDVETAEECVAETFSRLLIALRSGQGPAEFLKAYLYRVAHNWITDRYRRVRPEFELDPELRAGPQQEPHTVIEVELEYQELRRALYLLTPEQRQVISLKYLEQLDNTEIAGVIQKPVGSVKSLQHRALGALRRILAAEADQVGGADSAQNAAPAAQD